MLQILLGIIIGINVIGLIIIVWLTFVKGHWSTLLYPAIEEVLEGSSINIDTFKILFTILFFPIIIIYFICFMLFIVIHCLIINIFLQKEKKHKK